jgi:hypothetical protein
MSNIDAQINELREKIALLEKKKDVSLNAYYNAKKNKENVEYYIPDENEFQRMKDYSSNYEDMSYEDFILHNIAHIQKFSAADKIWFNQLCKRFQEGSVLTMDMESCAGFTASYIFFDHRGRLCIGNER